MGSSSAIIRFLPVRKSEEVRKKRNGESRKDSSGNPRTKTTYEFGNDGGEEKTRTPS